MICTQAALEASKPSDECSGPWKKQAEPSSSQNKQPKVALLCSRSCWALPSTPPRMLCSHKWMGPHAHVAKAYIKSCKAGGVLGRQHSAVPLHTDRLVTPRSGVRRCTAGPAISGTTACWAGGAAHRRCSHTGLSPPAAVCGAARPAPLPCPRPLACRVHRRRQPCAPAAPRQGVRPWPEALRTTTDTETQHVAAKSYRIV